ncbi:MAG: sporulation protein YqfD [Oscillospiraceae bacterium]
MLTAIPSFSGTVFLEITSAEPEKTIQELILSDISVRGIQKESPLCYRFLVFQKDLQHISEILQRRNDKFTILSQQGLYWHLLSFLKRTVLLLVLFLIISLTIYLPTRILFIEVEGNQILSDQEILSAAESCGISFGISRNQIRSEKTKNALLFQLPELQWAGINTVGCRAVISVRERISTNLTGNETVISNLVADQDAYILSSTVTSGTALVHPGDSVAKGQILISGYIDNGFHIRALRAGGEILGLTKRHLSAVMPSKSLNILEQTTTKYNISLIIRKKRINLWKDSRISDTCCGRMYEEYFVSLPGGYQLPVAICIDRYLAYQIEGHDIPQEDAYSGLKDFSEAYLKKQMIAGTILRKHHKIIAADNLYRLTSNYTCSEMIGREEREQIGEHNGKRN